MDHINPVIKRAIDRAVRLSPTGVFDTATPAIQTKSKQDLERWFYGAWPHPKSLDTRITQPLRQDAWFAACMDVHCRVMTQIPYIVHRHQDKTPVERSHPIQRLWLKPNPLMTRSQLWEATLVYRDVDGSCFYIFDWGQGLNNPQPGPPQHIWPFSGRYFRAVKAGGNIAGWEFSVPETMIRKSLLPEEMSRFWKFNAYAPLHDVGQSIVTAAARAMSVNYAAQSYELHYIENYGVPIAALKTERNYGDEWIQAQRDNWKKYYSGVHAAGDIAVLVGGLSLEQYKATIKDLRPDTLHEAAREAVCAVTGVPPGMVGILRYANYANLDVQKVLMLRFKTRPSLIQISEVLEADFYPRFAPDLYGEFDMTVFPELELSKADKILMAKELIQIGVTLRMIEEMLDIGIDVDRLGPLADTSFLTMNLITAGAAQADEAAKKLKALGLDGLFHNMVPSQKVLQGILRGELPEPDSWPIREQLGRIQTSEPALQIVHSPDDASLSKSQLVALQAPAYDVDAVRSYGVHKDPLSSWYIKVPADVARRQRLMLRQLRPLENKVQAGVKKWFFANRSEMLGNLFATAPALELAASPEVRATYQERKDMVTRLQDKGIEAEPAWKDVDPALEALVQSVLPNFVEQVGSLAELVIPLTENAMQIGGEATIAELLAMGLEVAEFTTAYPATVAFLASKRLQIKDVVGRYYEQMHRILVQGFLEGVGVGEIAQRIKYANNVASGRSQLIARTEMGGAVSEGRWQSMGDQGVGYKGWTHGWKVDKPRESHLRADGEVARFDEPFVRPGECARPGTLMRPFDWINGGACDWCRCSCGLFTPTKRPDAEGNLVDIPLDELFPGGKGVSCWTDKTLKQYEQDLTVRSEHIVDWFVDVFRWFQPSEASGDPEGVNL